MVDGLVRWTVRSGRPRDEEGDRRTSTDELQDPKVLGTVLPLVCLLESHPQTNLTRDELLTGPARLELQPAIRGAGTLVQARRDANLTQKSLVLAAPIVDGDIQVGLLTGDVTVGVGDDTTTLIVSVTGPTSLIVTDAIARLGKPRGGEGNIERER